MYITILFVCAVSIIIAIYRKRNFHPNFDSDSMYFTFTCVSSKYKKTISAHRTTIAVTGKTIVKITF